MGRHCAFARRGSSRSSGAPRLTAILCQLCCAQRPFMLAMEAGPNVSLPMQTVSRSAGHDWLLTLLSRRSTVIDHFSQAPSMISRVNRFARDTEVLGPRLLTSSLIPDHSSKPMYWHHHSIKPEG
jgi:hypothetical protein